VHQQRRSFGRWNQSLGHSQIQLSRPAQIDDEADQSCARSDASNIDRQAERPGVAGSYIHIVTAE